jgi:acyl carrier protein
MESIKVQLRQYIAENLLFNDNGAGLDDEESFLDSGVVDSLGVLELATFVEDTFAIEVPDDEVIPDNFDSISKLTAYIGRKTLARA